MQHKILKFINRFDDIVVENEYLNRILHEFHFSFVWNLNQTDKDIYQNPNKKAIITVNEYQENNEKYYFICYEYNFSIVKDPREYELHNLRFFYTNFYFSKQEEQHILNFSREFCIRRKFSFFEGQYEHFWRFIVKNLCLFLIKEGMVNSQKIHDNYPKEEFVGHKWGNGLHKNKSYIKLHVLYKNSRGYEQLIYHIPHKTIYAVKYPYVETQEEMLRANERERKNYLNIRYPYIRQYYGYFESNHGKILLLEYVEGKTLEEYDLNTLSEEEKYDIIFELILTVRYLHAQKYIARHISLDSIIINENKDAIMVDFSYLIKEDEISEDPVNNFIGITHSPDPYENISYKSDIYSLGSIIHYILVGKFQKINRNGEIITEDNFIFKDCLDLDPEKRPNINELLYSFYNNFFKKIKNKSNKENYLLSLFTTNMPLNLIPLLTNIKQISILNKHLQKIFDKFSFFFYEPEIEFPNETDIIIIDEYEENDNKYFIICHNYKLIVVKQEESIDFLRVQTNAEIYVFPKCNIPHIKSFKIDSIFLAEIESFSEQFSITNDDLKYHWNKIVNCLSAFLIKKGIQNSKIKHDNYSKEELMENQGRYESKIDSLIKLRRIGHGSCGFVYLIYHILHESIYAVKCPYEEMLRTNERERENYSRIRYPYIRQYYGYFESNHGKILLLEYVEGITLEEYDLNKLSEEEKYDIIFELILTVRYLHTQKFIARDISLDNIIINENKDAIMVDFSCLIKENEISKEPYNFLGSLTVPPELELSYKSDIYSLGSIIHYILVGKYYKIRNNKIITEDNFIFKDCLDLDPEKRPNINELLYSFYNNFFKKIKNKSNKENYLLSLFTTNMPLNLIPLLTNIKQISILNKHLQKIFDKFSFFFYEPEIEFPNETDIIIIDEYEENDNKYFIICHNYKLIVVKQEESIDFLRVQTNAEIYVFPKCNIPHIKSFKIDSIFLAEIESFSEQFSITNDDLKYHWNKIVNCLSAFLIKKGIQNSKIKHDNYSKEELMENQGRYESKIDSLIKLRRIGHGSCGFVYLIYHILHESIYAVKCPYEEMLRTNERERENYSRIRYPYIRQYYGYFESNHGKILLLEYVEGKTLKEYDLNKLSEEEKYDIIFELILTVRYLHTQKFIARDISLDNIIINENKDAIMIDFDRVIKPDKNEPQTVDFYKKSIAPEYFKTNKSDVFSLGYVIHYLLEGEIPEMENNIITKDNFIFEECFDEDPAKRPNMSELLYTFYINFLKKIKNKSGKENVLVSLFEKNTLEDCDSIELYTLGLIFYDNEYVSRDINKAIHYFTLAANISHLCAQYKLGCIYSEGQYTSCDMKKAIHYYSLAADQNNVDAQCALGLIYAEDQHDINQAIHYYTLAADQNNVDAQVALGAIYSNGQYVARDISKAIHNYSLAADQNNVDAQVALGAIYSNGQYVARDISKAIHNYSLAADQNNVDAQCALGLIYAEDQHDINQAIHYYTLAADQNNIKAQVALGAIYSNGQYVARDISKAIHNYSLAADQNNVDAQCALGLIYAEDQHDINQAIHYFTLAANQNESKAQYALGVIYSEGKYVMRDMNKSIFYYSLASNQNDSRAQYNLGVIYHQGIYVARNVNYAIYYYSLAANQYNSKALLALGLIYLEGQYVPQDVNKAFQYFSLAAMQGESKSPYNLGVLSSQRQDNS
ncbi:Serine/threonine-protein kinase plk4 [Tritrichomonas musculus]|uniref:Serine/threonine-protein kinase plk4 n=1 Tax=Tritrichomonas musculus TaxID=1915356 RepID=A0ABR2HB57_9EUKA